jgi:hypothetical protein
MLVSIRQASRATGIHPSTICKWLERTPEVNRLHLGNVVAIEMADVEQYKLVHKPRKARKQ